MTSEIAQWITETFGVINAVADHRADQSALTDERAGQMLIALRAVALDLHGPVDWGDGHVTCSQCKDDTSDDLRPWPCPTIRVISDTLGWQDRGQTEGPGITAEQSASLLDDLIDVCERIESREHDVAARDQMIRAALASGASVKHLTKLTGLSQARIYQIRDNRR